MKGVQIGRPEAPDPQALQPPGALSPCPVCPSSRLSRALPSAPFSPCCWRLLWSSARAPTSRRPRPTRTTVLRWHAEDHQLQEAISSSRPPNEAGAARRRSAPSTSRTTAACPACSRSPRTTPVTPPTNRLSATQRHGPRLRRLHQRHADLRRRRRRRVQRHAGRHGRGRPRGGPPRHLRRRGEAPYQFSVQLDGSAGNRTRATARRSSSTSTRSSPRSKPPQGEPARHGEHGMTVTRRAGTPRVRRVLAVATLCALAVVLHPACGAGSATRSFSGSMSGTYDRGSLVFDES